MNKIESQKYLWSDKTRQQYEKGMAAATKPQVYDSILAHQLAEFVAATKLIANIVLWHFVDLNLLISSQQLLPSVLMLNMRLQADGLEAV